MGEEKSPTGLGEAGTRWYRAAGCLGLHSEGNRRPWEGFEAKVEGPQGYVKQMSMSKKALIVQLLFKTYLESQFEVMFLN